MGAPLFCLGQKECTGGCDHWPESMRLAVGALLWLALLPAGAASSSLVVGPPPDEATLATLSSTGRVDDVLSDEPHVGTELEGGWWVKARLLESGGDAGKAGPTYRLCQGEGRRVNYKDAQL